MNEKPWRDIEKDYPLPQFIEKLRRLADALESGDQFEIRIAGERISARSAPPTISNMSAATARKRWIPDQMEGGISAIPNVRFRPKADIGFRKSGSAFQ